MAVVTLEPVVGGTLVQGDTLDGFPVGQWLPSQTDIVGHGVQTETAADDGTVYFALNPLLNMSGILDSGIITSIVLHMNYAGTRDKALGSCAVTSSVVTAQGSVALHGAEFMDFSHNAEPVDISSIYVGVDITHFFQNPITVTVSGGIADGTIITYLITNFTVVVTYTPAVVVVVPANLPFNSEYHSADGTSVALQAATQRYTPYSQQIFGGGGTAPYTFSILSGRFPRGLSLSTGGVIHGTALEFGTFEVTIQATEAIARSGSRAYTLVVTPAYSSLVPTTLN